MSTEAQGQYYVSSSGKINCKIYIFKFAQCRFQVCAIVLGFNLILPLCFFLKIIRISRSIIWQVVLQSSSHKNRKHGPFIGNAGGGKSTLANCIAGRILFKSGGHPCPSLTDRLYKEKHDGIMYLDTPGLDDVKKRRAAARAITEA